MDGTLHPARAPRVSVLTTTYNGARLIGQTIDSILAQTFTDFELVVVDDGSTDGTAGVIRAYRDPRLRLVRCPRNLGVVGSRNLGFAEARGEFVAAIDHDDLSLPVRLGRQVAYLDAHPAVVLVGTDDTLCEGGRMRHANAAFATDPMFMRWLLLLRNPIAYSSIMFRAAAVRRLGCFVRAERIYADDFDLYHRLLAVGEIGRVDERLTIYRLHGGNTFRARERQMIGNAEAVLRAAYAGLVDRADDCAAMVARFLFAREVTQDAAALGRMAHVLDTLRAAFVRRHALDAAAAARIARHVEFVLRDIAVRHLHSGRFLAVRPLLGRPALARALARIAPRVARSALTGALPARRALRALAERVAAPAPRPRAAVAFGPHVFRPASIEQDRPPTLFVVVDTEAEFDWSQPFSRHLTRVASIAAQGGMQSIFDGHGLRPVYVVDYPVATQAEAYVPLRAILDRGGCEIGAHHHPWTTPPIEEPPTDTNSYPGNLPPGLEARKFANLLAAIRAHFGVQPLFYKAGRYGLGAATPALLARSGIRVDFSVLPGVDLRPRGGPDFRRFDAVPYGIEGTGVLSLPMSRAALGLLPRLRPRLGRLAGAPWLRASLLGGVLSRAGLLEGVTLTPEGVTAAEQIRLLEAMLRRGHRLFVLHYHSPSLMPGNTPYVRSESDAREFRRRVERVLAHFLARVGGLPGNPRDLLPPALRGRQSGPGVEPEREQNGLLLGQSVG